MPLGILLWHAAATRKRGLTSSCDTLQHIAAQKTLLQKGLLLPLLTAYVTFHLVFVCFRFTLAAAVLVAACGLGSMRARWGRRGTDR